MNESTSYLASARDNKRTKLWHVGLVATGCVAAMTSIVLSGLAFVATRHHTPFMHTWVLHPGSCSLVDIASSIAYAQVFSYAMEPKECWMQYCGTLNCDVEDTAFRGCFVRVGRSVYKFSDTPACITAAYTDTPEPDAPMQMHAAPVRRDAPHTATLGGCRVKVHHQYARGDVTRNSDGSFFVYSASSNTGDGNDGKNRNAMRTEDSWQNANRIKQLSLSMRHDKTTTGPQIVHSVQIKQRQDDEEPVVGVGQKRGRWAVKVGNRPSESIGIEATRWINVQMAHNRNGKHDVLVNGKRFVSVRLSDESIVKTGLYTSNWKKSMRNGAHMRVRMSDVSLVEE